MLRSAQRLAQLQWHELELDGLPPGRRSKSEVNGKEDDIAGPGSSAYDVTEKATECKQGQHPYGAMICQLQTEMLLPPKWQCINAAPTYNPLGHLMTFLTKDKIVKAATPFLALD